ncbi:glycoside hydrolase family 43 protein [Fulvimarina manganoxydans]|uniref:glycoside hydrolase family 43 protein n=1 Tax=Fulvimarina manganoxydans TaxID=937218 RepID=UPI002353C3A7|nr:glycoside hydrolase family 43 protein [Fulvimarina manganoxydans]
MTTVTMTMIQNPILPGFNPDPSIVRVGEDYFIATSTFEWYPGVQIHHSRDLRNWRLVKRPLDRANQLDMRGDPDSGGVWAPCLTHSDGLFWLIYTDVKRRDGGFKDTHNYLVTAPSIEGPWSDPVYLNSSGFVPSLFHDEDGRKWLVNMIWDHNHVAPGDRFVGIAMQEYDPKAERLTGPIRNIYRGTPSKFTEGPHLYRRDGWYWLLTAEGGTGYDHAVTIARSKRLEGPYETDPRQHVLTAKGTEGTLQRAGHADIVETADGDFYMVHLCSRPLSLTDNRRSPLGRETAIQKLEWPAGEFPRLAHGGTAPADRVEAPKLAEHRFDPPPARTDFASPDLPIAFQWLRTPEPDRLFSLTERQGALRLFGRESPGSAFEHALIARRQTDFAFAAETQTDVEPGDYQQLAGLISWYGRDKFHYLAVTADEAGNRLLTVYSCAGDFPLARLTFPLESAIALPPTGVVRLGCDVDRADLRFRYALGDSQDWTTLPIVLDQSAISDEAGSGEGANFTGAFIGMAAHDTSGRGRPADFLSFSYEAR